MKLEKIIEYYKNNNNDIIFDKENKNLVILEKNMSEDDSIEKIFYIFVNNRELINNILEQLINKLKKENYDILPKRKNILNLYVSEIEEYIYFENNIDREIHINNIFNKSKININYNPKYEKSISKLNVGWTANRLEYLNKNQSKKTIGYGGFLYNIQITEIIKLYKLWGTKLFDNNIRLGIDNKKSGIYNSLEIDEERENVWYFNNGITMLVDSHKIIDEKYIEIKNPKIINGAQTTTNIFRHYVDYMNKEKQKEDYETTFKNSMIIIRILEKEKEKNTNDWRKITNALNNQKAVTISDRLTISLFMESVIELMTEEEIEMNNEQNIKNINKGYVFIKKGETINEYDYTAITLERLVQLFTSIILNEPGSAKRNSFMSQFKKFTDKIVKDYLDIDEEKTEEFLKFNQEDWINTSYQIKKNNLIKDMNLGRQLVNIDRNYTEIKKMILITEDTEIKDIFKRGEYTIFAIYMYKHCKNKNFDLESSITIKKIREIIDEVINSEYYKKHHEENLFHENHLYESIIKNYEINNR